MRWNNLSLALGMSLALGLALSGCGSLGDAAGGFRQQLAERDAGQTRVFAAPARDVHDAARTAAGIMGYQIVRAGAAQGILDAVSRVGAGEFAGTARQISMEVRLNASEAAGGTEVTVRLVEILEADSRNRAGQATQSPLRDTPQYEVFFREVSRAVGQPALDAVRPR